MAILEYREGLPLTFEDHVFDRQGIVTGRVKCHNNGATGWYAKATLSVTIVAAATPLDVWSPDREEDARPTKLKTTVGWIITKPGSPTDVIDTARAWLTAVAEPIGVELTAFDADLRRRSVTINFELHRPDPGRD